MEISIVRSIFNLGYKGRVMKDQLYDDAYFAHMVKTLVEQVPNDNQLGSEIRSLYYKTIESARA